MRIVSINSDGIIRLKNLPRAKKRGKAVVILIVSGLVLLVSTRTIMQIASISDQSDTAYPQLHMNEQESFGLGITQIAVTGIITFVTRIDSLYRDILKKNIKIKSEEILLNTRKEKLLAHFLKGTGYISTLVFVPIIATGSTLLFFEKKFGVHADDSLSRGVVVGMMAGSLVIGICSGFISASFNMPFVKDGANRSAHALFNNLWQKICERPGVSLATGVFAGFGVIFALGGGYYLINASLSTIEKYTLLLVRSTFLHHPLEIGFNSVKPYFGWTSVGLGVLYNLTSMVNNANKLMIHGKKDMSELAARYTSKDWGLSLVKGFLGATLLGLVFGNGFFEGLGYYGDFLYVMVNIFGIAKDNFLADDFGWVALAIGAILSVFYYAPSLLEVAARCLSLEAPAASDKPAANETVHYISTDTGFYRGVEVPNDESEEDDVLVDVGPVKEYKAKRNRFFPPCGGDEEKGALLDPKNSAHMYEYKSANSNDAPRP